MRIPRDVIRTLDSLDPTWYRKINLDTLDLRWGTTCVLGQVFSKTWGYSNNIDNFSGERFFLYNIYRPAWRRVIEQRRMAKGRQEIAEALIERGSRQVSRSQYILVA